ncbi:MAG: DUF2207 domain-containing protein, partial [Lachnospiraceae bacterium]|nr:DUF2207 domain-containing protein [Lachnospiraceae bacterium]
MNKIVRKINKLILVIVSSVLIAVFCCVTVFAKNHVDTMDIDVAIHKNGSATITQRWAGTFDEGTEVYIPIEDKNLIVKNLKVWKGNREYLSADGWNVDWSFENKKWRSGINYTNNGLELCFGISEYGNNIYTFSYDIDPLVRSYTDADGFNFQFINPNMSTFPSNATLRIMVDDDNKLSVDNARIWGFGFNGVAAFSEEGYAIAYSTSPLNVGNYLNVTLEIFKGMLTPNVRVNDTFENAVLNVALEGSSYAETLKQQNGSSLAEIFFAIIFGAFFISIIASIVSKVKRKAALKLFYKEGNYFRDKPNGGNLVMTHILYKDFDIWKNKETNVIGAIIMKLINNGNLEPLQEKSYRLFGREKISTSLKVGKEPEDPILRELYDIIIRAAGDDGVLQENELKKYAQKNYEALIDYIKSLDTKGRNALNQEGCYSRVGGKNLKDLNEKGVKELS